MKLIHMLDTCWIILHSLPAVLFSIITFTHFVPFDDIVCDIIVYI